MSTSINFQNSGNGFKDKSNNFYGRIKVFGGKNGNLNGSDTSLSNTSGSVLLSSRVVPWDLRDKIAVTVTILFSLLFLGWNVSINGYANSFYSAAAQAGSKSWEAFLWGSLDSSNSITIDKPPLGVWLPSLFIRAFGLSSWSILLPQVLLGVLTVTIIFAMVRRYFNYRAATLASILFLMTPIVTLMFRFNNPDALLIFFMVSAIYFTMRAIEDGKNKWLVSIGVMIGLGFLTKQFQVLLITPAIAVTYLMAGPSNFTKRLLQGFYTICSTIVSAGWWVLLTVLVPASDRPYIGGSQHNSFIELTFGYNGFGRLTGNETGSVGGGGGQSHGGGPGGNAMGGATGVGRLFTDTYASQWSWFAPAALILSIGAFILLWNRGRRDLQRSMIMLWSLWLIVTGITFSFMSGIFHQYYTVALVPAVAVLSAIGLDVAISHSLKANWKRIPSVTIILVASLSTIFWCFHIASKTNYMPWLKWVSLAITIITISILLGVFIMENSKNNDTIISHDEEFGGDKGRNSVSSSGTESNKRPENFFNGLSPVKKGMVSTFSILAISGAIAIPVAWSANTVNSSHQGSLVTAGPNSGGMGGGPGGMVGNNGPMGGSNSNQGTSANNQSNGSSSNLSQGSPNGSMNGSVGSNGPSIGQGSSNLGSGVNPGNLGNSAPNGQSMGGGAQSSINGGQGSMGGLLNGAKVNTQTVSVLSKDASKYKWVAATIGSQNAASYQLATEKPVMAIGGFNGSDPSPTLKEFKNYVTYKNIHYFIPGGNFGGQNGGSNSGSEITNWVKNNFKTVVAGDLTMYDLTQAK